MKKIYVLTVVCFAIALTGSAQIYTWTGAVNNNWRTAANWSPSTDFPHLAGDNAVFNITPANVSLDASIDLNSLTVTGGATVKITGIGTSVNDITLHSTNAGSPGLAVANTSSLESDAVSGSGLSTIFVDNGQATIAGTWILSGDADAAPVNFLLPSGGASTRINIVGKLVVGPNNILDPQADSDPETFLVFTATSTLELQSTTFAAYIPFANYSPASLILINGVTNIGPAIDDIDLGNITYDCPFQSLPLFLGLGDADLRGNLSVLNTGGQDLVLIGNGLGGGASTTLSIGGDLTISGNSKVIESKLDNNTETRAMIVGGNFTSAASFNLQQSNIVSIKTTTLSIKGNFIQTSGAFTVSSTAINQGTNLFVVEFNGTSGIQSVNSSSGSIDNTGNQVTLKVNNPSGVTLSSPLAVGRIDFSGATKGILNTGGNLLTINNTSGNAIVVNSPSNSGYVNGPVARNTVNTTQVTFPTGLSGTLRPIGITPAAASANTFVVNLQSGSKGGAPISPLNGFANYYWDVSRTAGAAAATLQLNLIGAVSGASATDTLIPVLFDGTNWADASGATGTQIFPGNSTSGFVLTGSQPSFTAQSSLTSFTFGFIINSALPINLLSFNGRNVQNSAELTWEISGNSTPAKFEIEKSVDGLHFNSAGSTAGLEGKLRYTFTDPSLAAGNNFYRLKMYDIDGSVTFSNIIVIMNGTRGVLISSMIPTIVKDRARLNISSSTRGNMQLVVTDISGRILLNQVASISSGNQEIWLNTSSLATGVFQVAGYINGEKTATIRFIKQ